MNTALVIAASTAGGGTVAITGCVFSGNGGGQGGAVRVEAGAAPVVVTNSIFVNNNAVNGEEAVWVWG